jgi:hypothetical protein
LELHQIKMNTQKLNDTARALVAALFDWAIIILSVLLGADLIVSGLKIPSSPYYWVILLVLIVVGIVVQAGFWHRRYPVKRTWGRRQSTESMSK